MNKRLFNRVRVTIIDGAGCGEAQSRKAAYPQDAGVNSILHAAAARPLDIPTFASLGLHHIPGLASVAMVQPKTVPVIGAFGAASPRHTGNGSPEGHQALMGYAVSTPYLYFDKTGFPSHIVKLVNSIASEVLKRPTYFVRYPGTDDINGVKFINHPGIGDVHYQSNKSGGPLAIPMYASSDSLIQIALHQEVVPQIQIEEIGKIVRAAVNALQLRIARVIVRPFLGGPHAGQFKRVSGDRKDYGVDPDGPTLIDYLKNAQIPIYGIGKAASMLNYHGFVMENVRKLGSDEERLQAILRDLSENTLPHFSFDNLIGTDELWGHTRKPAEYSTHISMIDTYVSQGLHMMKPSDLWILTADHGNDPTQSLHTNHTNENVPILVYSPRIKKAINLGLRNSYGDIAATVAENFGIPPVFEGSKSFLSELIQG